MSFKSCIPKQNHVSSAALIFIIMIILYGCANENPNLVNPPPFKESVNIRMLNFAGDGGSRILSLGEGTVTIPANYGFVTSAVKPPADSAFLTILKNNTEEFRMSSRVQFSRNTSYSFFALPSPYLSERNNPVDTLIYLYTVTGYTDDKISSYLRVLNAYPDSTARYTVSLGCPNGDKLVQQLAYRSAGSQVTVRGGDLSVSLVKFDASGGSSTIGVYGFNISVYGQYTLVIAEKEAGKEQLLLLDELDSTAQALRAVSELDQRITNIRAVNLASSSVDVFKYPDELVALELQPGKAGSYMSVGACSSASLDSIVTFVGGNSIGYASLSLGLLENYSAFVFDSIGKQAALTLVAQPVKLGEPQGNRSLIRVINGDYMHGGLTLSVGARTNASLSSGYSAGEVLCSELVYGEISQPALINPGVVPLTLFKSTQPAKLIFCTTKNFEAGKNYIIAITSDEAGDVLFYVIEDSDENLTMEPLANGIFVDFIHAVYGKDKIDLSIEPILDNAMTDYTGTLATVLTEGEHTVAISGKTAPLTAVPGKRNRIIAAGNQSNFDIFILGFDPIISDANNYRRRFFNACSDIPEINVNIDVADTLKPIVSNIAYGTPSEVITEILERKISFVFTNSATGGELLRVSDILLTFGKSYMIILTGNSTDKKYNCIIVQEY